MPLMFYETRYSAERAQAEVQRLLLSMGARRISQEYDDDRRVSGMSFSLQTPKGERDFLMPVRVDRVAAVLKRQGVLKRTTPKAHAESVAWRTTLEWLKLQLAIVETDQAKPDEVMLPYLMIPSDEGSSVTLYEQFSGDLALPSPARV